MVGREVFEFDVMGGGFALGFEGFELGGGGFQGGEGFAFFLFVAGGGGGGVFCGNEGVGGELGTLAGEQSGGAADLAVDGAPGGVDETSGIGNGTGAVLD